MKTILKFLATGWLIVQTVAALTATLFGGVVVGLVAAALINRMWKGTYKFWKN